VSSRGPKPTEPGGQEDTQLRMGLTQRRRTSQALVGPFGAVDFTFAFSVGFHPWLLVVLPWRGAKASLKLD